MPLEKFVDNTTPPQNRLQLTTTQKCQLRRTPSLKCLAQLLTTILALGCLNPQSRFIFGGTIRLKRWHHHHRLHRLTSRSEHCLATHNPLRTPCLQSSPSCKVSMRSATRLQRLQQTATQKQLQLKRWRGWLAAAPSTTQATQLSNQGCLKALLPSLLGLQTRPLLPPPHVHLMQRTKETQPRVPGKCRCLFG